MRPHIKISDSIPLSSKSYLIFEDVYRIGLWLVDDPLQLTRLYRNEVIVTADKLLLFLLSPLLMSIFWEMGIVLKASHV